MDHQVIMLIWINTNHSWHRFFSLSNQTNKQTKQNKSRPMSLWTNSSLWPLSIRRSRNGFIRWGQCRDRSQGLEIWKVPFKNLDSSTDIHGEMMCSVFVLDSTILYIFAWMLQLFKSCVSFLKKSAEQPGRWPLLSWIRGADSCWKGTERGEKQDNHTYFIKWYSPLFPLHKDDTCEPKWLKDLNQRYFMIDAAAKPLVRS